MLIPLHELVVKYKLQLRGVLHVGAHECEEAGWYAQEGVKDVKWLEGNPTLVRQQKERGFDVHEIVASDTDGTELIFNVTNNGQSSSILPLGTHKDQYPHIVYCPDRSFKAKTKRISTLFAEKGWSWAPYNFLNLDIQGAELMALKGMEDQLHRFDAIYTEVNVAELYVGAGLLPELDAFLFKYGFQRMEMKLDTPTSGWGDALYVRTSPSIKVELDEKHGVLTAPQASTAPPYRIILDCPNFGKRGGGLGDQLFQIGGMWSCAAALSDSFLVRLGEPLQPSNTHPWKYESFFQNANKLLAYTPLDETVVATRYKTINWTIAEKREGSHAALIETKSLENDNDNDNLSSQIKASFATSTLDQPHRYVFHGAFQNAALLEPARSFLRRVFTPTPEIDAQVVRVFQQNCVPEHKTECVVAMHVARSDSYCLAWSYYMGALASLEKENAQTTFTRLLIFTDDGDYVKQMIEQDWKTQGSVLKNTRLATSSLCRGHQRLGGNPQEDPWSFLQIMDLYDEKIPSETRPAKEREVMHLLAMSKFDYKIMSHSSLSWWAAFLGNPEHDDRVLVPALPFPHRPNSDAMMCTSWKRLVPQWEWASLNDLTEAWRRKKENSAN